MRNYSFEKKWQKLLTPEIVSYLTIIHEYKVEQRLIADKHADILTNLINIAKIQSTGSSNKIEGIFTTEPRLKKIVMDKTMPKTRSEREIAGYRDVLNIIHENNEFIPITPNFILQLHRNLYRYEGDIGGVYKSADNIIQETDSEGNSHVRFTPVAAWETPEALNELCNEYNKALNDSKLDPLLLMPMFVLDFLCIHPFKDGNGRMSRLLTLLLLYKSDYVVGKYISIEKQIENTKEDYYDALQTSSMKWHENKNDYEPFVKYMLSMVVAAYKDFMERTKLIEEKTISKPDRIEETIKNHLGRITKSEILELVPGVSQTTVQRTLTELVKSGKIIKDGDGRYTKYHWNWEAED